MEIVNDKALLIRTRNPDKYTAIPRSKVVEQYEDGSATVAVFWGLDESRVLKNLGVKNVPSPITRRYDWPGRHKPMVHQIETASFLTMNRKAFVFSEPGTGKTLSALWAADYLMKRGEVRRVLVLCPLSIMQSAWMQDLNASIIHRSAIIAHHPQASRRIEMVQKDYEFVITNYEGLNLIASEVKNNGKFDLVIVDECFVAGTLVSTPLGRRPIECLQTGDKVLTSDGVMCINRLVCNTATQLVEVKLGNGKTIRCTPEHPFFTDAGWVCAKNLTGRRLISNAELSCLRAGISPRAFPNTAEYGEQPTPWIDLFKILCTEEMASTESRQERIQQLVTRAAGQTVGPEVSRTSRKTIKNSESQWVQASCKDGEWHRHDPKGAVDFRGLTCGVGMELPRSIGWEAARLSYELQARLCVAGEEDRVRSGWGESHSKDTPTTGLQEGGQTKDAWVDSITYIECPNGEAVFNIEVKGTPNYFVGDQWLVHNCNAYKTATTKRWKSLASVVGPDTLLWMMTGTPASQSPVDAYGLAKLVNPNNVPKFFTAWRDKVMNKITMFKWAPKADATDIVHAVLQPAIRFTKKECLDLPPVVTMTREVPMTPQQIKYYNMLKDQMLVQTAGETISAVNAAAGVSKLLQISCIAYNTPVLTQLGWMPICNVTSDDYVWDGEYWVRCEGAVFKGMRQTMVLDGVTLTPEHLVLTDNGWKPAEECANGYASKRFGRTEVRLPDGLGKSWDIKWEDEESNVALPMRLRGRSGTGIPELALYPSPKPKALWVPSRDPIENPRTIDDTAVQHLVGDAPQMYEPKRQGLQKLRSTWHHCLQTMGKFVREFLGGYAGRVCRHTDTGPQGCQQGVYQSELSMGNSERTEQQHTRKSSVGNSEGLYDCGAGRTGLRVSRKHLAGATDTLRLAATRSVNSEGETAVFDLINCGPRNRFVVRGDNGEHLIVHNCGAAYTDNGEVIEFDAAPRLRVLEEILEETDRKVIVFALFTSSLDAIHNYLLKQGISNEMIRGDVPPAKRGDIIRRFQNEPDPKILVMQPAASAHGITLTAADTVVFYGPLMSVEQYVQCCARADRKGQTSDKVTVIHIEGSPIEKKMFKALGMKVSDHSLLTQLFDTEIKK